MQISKQKLHGRDGSACCPVQRPPSQVRAWRCGAAELREHQVRKLMKINKTSKLQKSIANNAMKPGKTTPKPDFRSTLPCWLQFFRFLF